ncbi:NUDIX domain-containing protein [Streptomyces sp. NPDC058467]|uniref:NUDIX domain-containing protein n=1 Tax=unclassified Streptomyces TaxID=2593676 RepID=UPI0036621B45
MPITAQHVRNTLDAYLAQHPDEKDRLSVLSEVLDEAGDSITSRKECQGQVTAGAVLLRPDGRVLQIEHKALGIRLFPGGHVEDSDATLLDAALRELAEEAGIGAGRRRAGHVRRRLTSDQSSASSAAMMSAGSARVV